MLAESTFKKSNTCGVSNNRLYFTLSSFNHRKDDFYENDSTKSSFRFQIRRKEIYMSEWWLIYIIDSYKSILTPIWLWSIFLFKILESGRPTPKDQSGIGSGDQMSG